MSIANDCVECGVALGRFPHTSPGGDVCADCCARCKPPSMPWPSALDPRCTCRTCEHVDPWGTLELPVAEVLGRCRTAMNSAVEYLDHEVYRDELDTITDRLYDLLGNLEADYPSPQNAQGDLLIDAEPF